MIATLRETAAVADWLGLAAAPTFAIMALLTGVLGGDRMEMLCSTADNASPLAGMAAMYVLMSVFHSGPWLKVIPGHDRRQKFSGAKDNG